MAKTETWTTPLDPFNPYQRIPLESREAVPVEESGTVLSVVPQDVVTRPNIPEEAITRHLPPSFDFACSLLHATREQCVMILTRPGAGYVIRTVDL